MHTLHIMYAEKCSSNHKCDEFVKKQKKIYIETYLRVSIVTIPMCIFISFISKREYT